MAYDDINALGFVEVRGLAAAIETADAMLKCADVRLLRQLLRDPVQTTLTVEGSLGACRAAVDAGEAVAVRLGAFVSSSVMGRPADDTAEFVLRFFEEGRVPFGAMAADGRQVMKAAVAKPVAKATAEPVAKPVVKPDVKAAAKASVENAASADEAKLLAVLATLPRGIGAQALAKEVGGDAEAVRQALESLCARGTLVKRRGRYLLAKPDGEKK
jgi:ethanolamine utilization protein EutK